MPNRLAQESSPYLLQHRDNPVDWYAWGDEALARAREEDRAILVSIGYSACHWCHVMERESFEDAETAAAMNASFVCIKVDREERPDVDDLYMEAVTAMTGQGGWPLTVFCDSDGVPFHGGTYFPPEPRHGLPSFRELLTAVANAYSERRSEIADGAERIREGLGGIGRMDPPTDEPGRELLAQAVGGLLQSADTRHGGFSGAPKFPPASALEFLLARGELAPVRTTLDAMLQGGIYDQVGGGFARYSVDGIWLVPHFEKMLYDNALLARAYLHGWLVLGEDRYRRICCETLDWALREMRGHEGGFNSALDADSEGVEGLFYVWDEAEMREVLSDAGLAEPESEQVLGYWGVSRTGNFEGRNILHVPAGAAANQPGRLADARRALLGRREQRVRPGLDDKRLCAWNALMISALADAGAVLGRKDYLVAATECAEFVLGSLRDERGRLLRTWKNGEGKIAAYLGDHAYLVEALLTLYEATFEVRWFEAARETADSMIERFGDDGRGGFFTTAADGEQLIARRKDVGDHPLPSGNASAALGLLRLGALTGEASYTEHAAGVLRLFGHVAVRQPSHFGHLLQALDFHLSPTREVALIAPPGEGATGAESTDGGALAELAAVVRSAWRPKLVLAGGEAGASVPELLAGRGEVDGRAAAYVCESFTCQAPVTDAAALAAELGSA